MCVYSENSFPGNECVYWHVRSKYLMEAPELHERIPAREPCVTDVLCNWEINPK